MNKVKRYCDAAWSGISLVTVISLFAALLYWTVLQRPPLTYTTEGLKTTYVTGKGMPVYLENPIYPPDTTLPVQISASLINNEGTGGYRLASINSRDGFKPSAKEALLSYVRPGYPVYGAFIPSYVKSGSYTYKATATYRLNLFRTVTMELPDLTIVVE
jgi:hypothetical protein